MAQLYFQSIREMSVNKILLAEDDLDDQDIFKEAVAEASPGIDLVMFDNGEKLLNYMDQLDDAELPALIVLDQNMPRLKGNETVYRLRENERFKNIPAVIYSTYHDPRFIGDCDSHRIELLLKPDTFDAFSEMVKDLVGRYINK